MPVSHVGGVCPPVVVLAKDRPGLNPMTSRPSLPNAPTRPTLAPGQGMPSLGLFFVMPEINRFKPYSHIFTAQNSPSVFIIQTFLSPRDWIADCELVPPVLNAPAFPFCLPRQFLLGRPLWSDPNARRPSPRVAPVPSERFHHLGLSPSSVTPHCICPSPLF